MKALTISALDEVAVKLMQFEGGNAKATLIAKMADL
jgi:hypothetical protein